MEFIIILLFVLATLQTIYILRLRSQLKKPVPTKELTEFLADLQKGAGLVAFRVNPDHLIVRSPRG
jgi:hypothetical protein